jgi:hypothetical protein
VLTLNLVSLVSKYTSILKANLVSWDQNFTTKFKANLVSLDKNVQIGRRNTNSEGNIGVTW